MLYILLDLLSCLHRPAAFDVTETDAACACITTGKDSFEGLSGIKTISENEWKLQILVVNLSLDTEADDSEGLM